MSLVRVWNSLFKAAIILINIVNEPLIAVMDPTLQLTTIYTPIRRRVHVGGEHAHTDTQRGAACIRMHVTCVSVFVYNLHVYVLWCVCGGGLRERGVGKMCI